MKLPVTVLVVDDSALMRRELSRIIEADPDCRVVGTASDGLEGLDKARSLEPDVVTLDINLPAMDGITCLQHIMIESPRPCVMISAHSGQDSLETFEALELGAVDFVQKPSGEISRDIHKLSKIITRKIKDAANANMSVIAESPMNPEKNGTRENRGPANRKDRPDAVVVIGVSTGGPRTLLKIIPVLPPDMGVPVLIIQHMPPKFTNSFANRLNQYSRLHVKEAENNEPLLSDTVYVAPGGFHLGLKKERGNIFITTQTPQKGDTLVPSVDKAMNSCIDVFGNRTVGVILTGMGNDGLMAMTRLFDMGGRTIAESKTTAVIYGMPKEVVDKKVARQVVGADDVPGAILLALKLLIGP